MGVLNKMFGKYLLVTNTMSCGLMMGAGDVMQQRSDFLKRHMTKPSEQRTSNRTTPGEEASAARPEDEPDGEAAPEGYDYVRTRNMTAVGLLQGPFHHYFYTLLEKHLPGKSTGSIFKKTVLDQTIASPTCLGIFFFGLGVLERRTLHEINSEVKLKLASTWKVDCMFWPPTQFLNFLFVPIRYRVIYINFMTMIYDMFLSYMKYDAPH